MKRCLTFIAILATSLNVYSNKPGIDASPVLNKVLTRLNGLKTVSYTYKRIIDYPGESYHDEMTIDSYLEFNPSAQFIGLRYQFSNSGLLTVYNGVESFYCDKKEKTIEVNYSPKLDGFKNSSNLFNSYLTLKNALPGIIADNNIPKVLSDTTISGKQFYVADITLKNETLNSLGEYVHTTMELKFSYKVIIDKGTFMPVEVIQHTLSNKDITKTQFTDINLSPAKKSETSWYSSSYDDYKLKKDEKIELIKPGATIPETPFIYFSDQKAVKLSELTGNIVLLQFWIKDCGHCIEDVDPLNTLYAKYKSKNFKLLAVNTHDTKNMISLFIKNHGIKYDVLTASNDIEKSFGISGFPAMVLLDKSGKVIYADYGLNEKKLASIIEQNL
ncbi:MAG: TlpA family protein disulfide reductase [Bacteroidota bacterium]|nr:TlpA family protein disulfide reductase [Bacteroidota bacterium]